MDALHRLKTRLCSRTPPTSPAPPAEQPAARAPPASSAQEFFQLAEFFQQQQSESKQSEQTAAPEASTAYSVSPAPTGSQQPRQPPQAPRPPAPTTKFKVWVKRKEPEAEQAQLANQGLSERQLQRLSEWQQQQRQQQHAQQAVEAAELRDQARPPPLPLPPPPPPHLPHHRRWPFSLEAIALTDPDGNAVALPHHYTGVRGTQREVVLRDIFSMLLTGRPALEGGPARLRASGPEPGAEAGELSTKTRFGVVTWAAQLCGGRRWGRVCMPLVAMAAVFGSCNFHPRAKGSRVSFSVGRMLMLRHVSWAQAAEEEEWELPQGLLPLE